MPDFNVYFGSRGKAASMADDPNTAYDTYRMVLDNAVSITLKRGTSTLAAQTVMITPTGSTPGAAQGAAGQSGTLQATVIGVRNHGTISDLDIARGDKFVWGGVVWAVRFVYLLPGAVEATCEGLQ